MNYEQFIKMLSSLTSTEQILITLFNYFSVISSPFLIT